MMATKKTRGRPAGSKNGNYDESAAEPSRCQQCGSTEREPYFGEPIETEYSGVTVDGRAYTHIVRRRTRCRACGQIRFDRAHENRITDVENK